MGLGKCIMTCISIIVSYRIFSLTEKSYVVHLFIFHLFSIFAIEENSKNKQTRNLNEHVCALFSF